MLSLKEAKVTRNFALWEQLNALIEDSPEVVPCANASLHLLTQDGQRIICQAVSAGYRATMLAYGLDFNNCTNTRQALDTHQPVLVTDALADGSCDPAIIQKYGLRAALYVPLLVGQEARGVMSFSYPHPHLWQPEQVQRALAQAAAAAQLFEQEGACRPHTEPTLSPDSTRRLRALMGVQPGMVLVVDRDLNVCEAHNSAAETAWPNLRELAEEHPRGAELRQAVQDLWDGERNSYAILLEENTALWHLRLVPLRNGATIEGVAVAATDMADTVRARELLRASQRLDALGRLSASIAHKFNNFLQIIAAALDSFSLQLEGDTSQRQLAFAQSAIERGAKLSRQFLTFARAGQPQEKPNDLQTLVTEWWPDLQKIVGAEREMTLEVSGPVRVRLDAERVQGALQNLCTNAREATPPGGVIRLTLSEVERHGLVFAALTVTDNGCGMTPEILQNAAEPFFTTKPPGLNTGLGLSLAKSVADMHGGFLELASTPHQGTQATLLFLLDHTAAPQVAPQPVAPASLAALPDTITGNVLVVEDEPNIALWLEEMLGTLGYSVKVADTIAASFGIFAEDPAWPDLVLLDMTLPDGTGLEVYRTLRAARPSLPFIICSGYADTEQVSTIQEDGHKMLHKPFGQDELVLLMRQILAQAGHVGRQK